MKILVSSWNNGRQNLNTGAGYGIRISKSDYKAVKSWRQIKFFKSKLILHRNGKIITADCPEIRSSLIGTYLIKHKINKWLKGKPYKLIFKLIDKKNKIWELGIK
jgi:hypothetical protein